MPHIHTLTDSSFSTFFPSDPIEKRDLPIPPDGCLLNIKTNMRMESRHGWIIQGLFEGNYSPWIDVSVTESVAVSGMSGCASLFVANHDWSKIAACHMSGGAQYSDAWCEALLETGSVKPSFMVFTTSENSFFDEESLAKYKEKLNIKEYLWIKGCGAILVQRIIGGQSLVFAGINTSDINIP